MKAETIGFHKAFPIAFEDDVQECVYKKKPFRISFIKFTLRNVSTSNTVSILV